MTFETIITKKLVFTDEEKRILNDTIEIFKKLYDEDFGRNAIFNLITEPLTTGICDFDDMGAIIDVLINDDIAITEE